MKRKKYTQDDRVRILGEISSRVKSGETIRAAIKDAGLTSGMYYAWLRKSGKRKSATKTPTFYRKKPQILDLPVHQESQMVMIMGPVSQVIEALNRLARIHGAA